jgi:hypothetical protein
MNESLHSFSPGKFCLRVFLIVREAFDLTVAAFHAGKKGDDTKKDFLRLRRILQRCQIIPQRGKNAFKLNLN